MCVCFRVWVPTENTIHQYRYIPGPYIYILPLKYEKVVTFCGATRHMHLQVVLQRCFLCDNLLTLLSEWPRQIKNAITFKITWSSGKFVCENIQIWLVCLPADMKKNSIKYFYINSY